MNTSPVRVLMLFTIMNRGGAETMVMNYFRNIDRSKLIFDFIVHREKKGDYDDEIKSLGGKIYSLPAITPGNLFAYKRAIKIFFDEHPEYRIIHGHCSELGLWIYKEASRRGIKFIAAHAHNTPLGWDIKMPFRNVLKHLMRPYLTHYFTCSADSAHWLFGRKRAFKAIFQPNAIDARKFSFNQEIRERVRNAEKWNNKLVIGNVARFDKQKNHIFLLDIISELVKIRKDILCVFVGAEGGDEYKKIRKRIKQLNIEPYVRFLGSRKDVSFVMQGMDVFVFPSIFEGFGIVAIEAQAAGLPTIVSERIPKEAYVSDLCIKELLESNIKDWVDKIIYFGTTLKRENKYVDIVKKGFDIQENAKWLTQIYLGASTVQEKKKHNE